MVVPGHLQRIKRKTRRGDSLVALRARENQALEFRLAGLSYEEVGRAMVPPISQQGAQKMIHRRLTEFAYENAAEIRAIECKRLDKLLVRLQAGIAKGDVKAITAALAISAQRCKLLGINAPERIMLDQGLEKILVIVREVVSHEQFEAIALRLAPPSSIETTGEEQGAAAAEVSAEPEP